MVPLPWPQLHWLQVWRNRAGTGSEKANPQYEETSCPGRPFAACMLSPRPHGAGSLAGASRVLNVTPSAVSHLLRELEQTLGLTLFDTKGSNARLSEIGERLGRRLAAAYDSIDCRDYRGTAPGG